MKLLWKFLPIYFLQPRNKRTNILCLREAKNERSLTFYFEKHGSEVFLNIFGLKVDPPGSVFRGPAVLPDEGRSEYRVQ